jgi:HKD family nuclease
MVVPNLKNQLEGHLPEATAIYVAVALVKETALSNLLGTVPPDAEVKFIAGVNLPTTTKALELLKSLGEKNPKIKCGIYYDKTQSFHAKTYLIKKPNEWIAFVSSGNLTEGGLSENIEMSYMVSNQDDCKVLLAWFDDLFAKTFPIDDHNLREKSTDQNDDEGSTKRPRKVYKFKKPGAGPLDGIDFTDRFFKREHHIAFRKELWLLNSLSANKERENAELRFLGLNDLIYSRFQEFGLTGLYTNTEENVVSRHHQINTSAPRKLNGMWLSYGKSQDEVDNYRRMFPDQEQKKYQTFIHHARLQIRIELESIGIWFLFGKENKGSVFDRDYFKQRMKEVSYRTEIFNMIDNLSAEYWIDVNEVTRDSNTLDSPDDLHTFTKKDDYEKYFIIGRDYKITDPRMSESALPTETLNVFKLLFPLYRKMRHYLPK